MPAEAGLELLGAVELRSLAPEFGGFSAIEVSADGARAVMLSDRAHWLEGRILRRDGALSGLGDARLRPALPPDSPPIRRDAEGLAIADPDLAGPRIVSFERLHRIEALEAEGGPADPVPNSVDAQGWTGNSGLEGLAHAPDGRLLAIRERGETHDGPVPAWWIEEGGRTTRIELPRLRELSLTGADFGPDGRLYVTARGFDWLTGFAFAIWSYAVEGDALTDPRELLSLAGVEGADNAEGIAAWRGPDGRVRLLVVTDDNFNLLQRTLLYEFAVPPS